MKNKIFKTFVVLVLLLNTYFANACAPFSPNLITVWEYNWTYEKEFPYEISWRKIFVNLDNKEKIFWNNYLDFGKYYYVNTDRINIDKYKKWDLLIAVADYNNWDFEEYFEIYEVWKISCKNDDEFFIEYKEWKKTSFWKEMWYCWNYEPEDVMSEEELLGKIKDKYKTCDALAYKSGIGEVVSTENREIELEENIDTLDKDINTESKENSILLSILVLTLILSLAIFVRKKLKK